MVYVACADNVALLAGSHTADSAV